MESSRRDLSIQRVVKGCFLIFGGGKSICHSFLIDFVRKKKHVFVTKSVGKRFHELSLGRNNLLGLGTPKIEALANNSKKNKEKQRFSDSGLWPGLGGRAKRKELRHRN